MLDFFRLCLDGLVGILFAMSLCRTTCNPLRAGWLPQDFFFCIPLVFGCPNKVHQEGDGTPYVCPRCHNAQVVEAKSRTWFELCWIPLVSNGAWSVCLYYRSLFPLNTFGSVVFASGKCLVTADSSHNLRVPCLKSFKATDLIFVLMHKLSNIMLSMYRSILDLWLRCGIIGRVLFLPLQLASACFALEHFIGY